MTFNTWSLFTDNIITTQIEFANNKYKYNFGYVIIYVLTWDSSLGNKLY